MQSYKIVRYAINSIIYYNLISVIKYHKLLNRKDFL
nr:MAG TPA: hypothetical protein [Caudoviricetes sp.]